ncbi:hypothetical protein [Opitutus sp. ER46]|uniref:hypothetical protein n=1 Tax=Opitutus sp. ER46 TaxID=2161864 RepID=UPI000D2FEFF1|nr:hypothetical protein [Opitutus sp. ER46]PTX97783.1 hypothetical protein DB354_05760 [Opitutus sp. ER46]
MLQLARRLSLLLALLAASRLLAEPSAASPLNATALFAAHLKVVGGEAALAGIDSVVVTGTFSLRGQEASFEFRARTSGAFLLATRGPGDASRRYGRDVRGAGWVDQDGAVAAMSPGETRRWGLLAFAFLPHTQYPWRSALADAVCSEFTQGPDQLVWVKHRTRRDFPPLLFYRATQRVRRIGPFELRDYRFTEGVVVPFLIKHGPEARFVVKSVAFVAPLDDAQFEAPTTGAADTSANRGFSVSPSPDEDHARPAASADGADGRSQNAGSQKP